MIRFLLLIPSVRQAVKDPGKSGALNKIRAGLRISPKTVESHAYSLMERLESRTVAELTKYAVRHGLTEV